MLVGKRKYVDDEPNEVICLKLEQIIESNYRFKEANKSRSKYRDFELSAKEINIGYNFYQNWETPLNIMVLDYQKTSTINMRWYMRPRIKMATPQKIDIDKADFDYYKVCLKEELLKRFQQSQTSRSFLEQKLGENFEQKMSQISIFKLKSYLMKINCSSMPSLSKIRCQRKRQWMQKIKKNKIKILLKILQKNANNKNQFIRISQYYQFKLNKMFQLRKIMIYIEQSSLNFGFLFPSQFLVVPMFIMKPQCNYSKAKILLL